MLISAMTEIKHMIFLKNKVLLLWFKKNNKKKNRECFYVCDIYDSPDVTWLQLKLNLKIGYK